jgi:hypothetical protein
MAKRIKRLGYIEFIDGHKEDIVKIETHPHQCNFVKIITTEGIYVYTDATTKSYFGLLDTIPIHIPVHRNVLYRIIAGLYYHALDGVEAVAESFECEYKEIVTFKRW